MIPIKRLSPSSITTLDGCEMKWVLQYAMGYRDPSGKSAAIGTICHYVLECVARAKRLRDNGRKYEKNDILGRVTVEYDLDEWINKIYSYYVKKENHLVWEDKDYREVCRNIKKAQEHRLYPDNHKDIIQTEHFFNLPILSDWGEYAYTKGKKIDSGKVHMVGVIDLVFRDSDNILNIVDYKFGQAKDWNTGVKKEHSNVIKDIQLCMYYYAMKQVYPNENILINLWYVKEQKLFSDFFGPDQEQILWNKIRSSLNKIRSIEKPDTNYSFKCGFCPFKNTNFGDWGRQAIDLDYNKVGHVCHFDPVNGKASVCDATKIFFDYRGLTATIEAAKNAKEKK